jgi:hypothetical protein
MGFGALWFTYGCAFRGCKNVYLFSCRFPFLSQYITRICKKNSKEHSKTQLHVADVIRALIARAVQSRAGQLSNSTLLFTSSVLATLSPL